jgi:Spy/CpxP family protein refolding chaperone
MPEAPQRLPGPGMGDSMMQNFFPPELVMQNQGQLGLSDVQKAEIRDAMRKAAAESTDLQWQQSAETEAMGALINQERVDEAKALAQLDKLSDIEKQIKRVHLGTMIRIKNALTPEQQTRLRQLRPPMAPGRGRMPGQFGPQERGGPGEIPPVPPGQPVPPIPPLPPVPSVPPAPPMP